MGRRSFSSFEDELVGKVRDVVHQVLTRINEEGELEHVSSLYPKRGSSSSTPASRIAGSEQDEEARHEYTFEHFVQHLDVDDSTFHNLIELLVTTTARQAIARAAAEQNEGPLWSVGEAGASTVALPMPAQSSSSSSTNTRERTIWNRLSSARERDCQREMLRSRAVQNEIRNLTRRNRRQRRREESDSSSSDTHHGHSPPPTRTVFSTLTDAQLTFSPDPVFDSGATSRAIRVGQLTNSNTGNANANGTALGSTLSLTGAGAHRWLQRDVSSIRRRIEQRRNEYLERHSPSSGVRGTGPTVIPRNTSSSNLRAQADGFHMTSSSSVASEVDRDNAFVQRFLTQSFPTTATPASPRASGQMPLGASHSGARGGLDATLAAPRLSPWQQIMAETQREGSSFSPEEVEMINAIQEANNRSAQGRDSPVTSGEQPSSVTQLDSGAAARLDAAEAALNRLSASMSTQPATGPFAPPLVPSADRADEFAFFSARRRQHGRLRRDVDGGRREEGGGEQDEGGHGAGVDDGEDAEAARLNQHLEETLASLNRRADQTLEALRRQAEQTANAAAAHGSMRTDGLVDNDDRRDPLRRRLEPATTVAPDARPTVRLPLRSRSRSGLRDTHETTSASLPGGEETR